MDQINLITNKAQLNHHSKLHTPNKPSETHETHHANASRAAHRKFLAEATQAVLPTVATDEQIETDLKNLNSGIDGAWDQLMKDIGGEQNLSTYRNADHLSLLDICGTIFASNTDTLITAATQLLDKGFQYSVAGQNDLPPRYQWGWDANKQEEENGGYCGETSLITAALANGEYISQYDAREIAVNKGAKSQTGGELYVGDNDQRLAQALHLSYDEWNVPGGTTKDFVDWMTKQVNSGHPVVTGIYLNPSAFGETGSGDPQYDHIVVVTGIKDGMITFCDNGLHGGNTPSSSGYMYTYPLDKFIGTRDQADKSQNIYTLPLFNNDPNYNNNGVAIQGVMDTNSETLPIHLLTNVNNEPNEIKDGSNTRPAATPVTLTGCITGLTPGKKYNIYVYDKVGKNAIPDSDFNKNANMAAKCITFTATGSSYAFTNQIMSSDQIAYRVVPADGP